MMTRQDIFNRFKNNSLVKKIGLNADNFMMLNACLDKWQEPHRYYHGINHLSFLLNQVDKYRHSDMSEFTNMDVKWDFIEVLALLHDVIYDPRFPNNEANSIRFIKSLKIIGDNTVLEKLFDAINDTRYDSNQYLYPEISKIFCSVLFDLNSLSLLFPSDIMKSEVSLIKEFQCISYPKYRKNRLEFLQNFKACNVTEKVIDFVTNYRPRIGVYAGSFNPFHIGHMNILEQAERIFDKVIIAIGNNPDKQRDMALRQPDEILPFHEVIRYNGLLSDFIETIDYADVTLVRGLRSGYDLEYEMDQLRTLEDLGCKCSVVYFLCDKDTSHVSSSMIRGLCKFSPVNGEKYTPKKYNYAKIC